MADTYREELAITYPTHGHALWEPDPGGLYDSVQVGDVGFIRGGYFYRLFNALLSRDHPSDPDHPSNPDPPSGLSYPSQLRPKTSHHIRKSQDNHKDFRSTNVTKFPHEPDLHALG